MNWFKNFFAMHQDENTEGTPSGDGSAGNSAAGNQPPAQAGNEGSAASQSAGNGNQPSAWAPMELEYKGQKISVATREEAIALLQQGHDYTQKTQALSKEKQAAFKARQEYMAKLESTTKLLAELEAKRNKPAEGEGNEGGEPPAEPTADNPKLQELERQLAELRDEKNAEAWTKLTAPILQKFPDVPEAELADAFAAAVDRGEVENTLEGLQEVAEQMNTHYTGEISKRLEKQLGQKDSPLVKAHNDKVIADFLADANNPKLQEYAQRVIADYVKGKLKLKDAAGDAGKGQGAGASDKKESIAEIAARHRAGTRED